LKKQIKKVMLIQPPVTRPGNFSAKVVRVSVFFPLGIAYIAAVLEQDTHYELKVIDALADGDLTGTTFGNEGMIRYGMTDEQLIESIHSFSPDVIGVSCLFSANEWDMNNVCEIAKKINPDVVTVIGGAHISAVPDSILQQYKAVDFAIIGEAEVTFINLLEALQVEGDFAEIDGVAFRDAGQVKLLPKSRYINHLDALPYPSRHLFPMDKYFSPIYAHSTYRNTPYAQMITSRGCPYRCSFCALAGHWGNRFRFRSAKSVLDEIERLIGDYGIKEIHFEDDNLTANKARAMEIFNGIIDRGFGITWNVPSGMAAKTLDNELLDKMAQSGCYSVSLAIESGNQEVLTRLMNKPVDLNVVPDLVKKIRSTGMDVRGFFIIGYPGETKGTINQTIDYARELELDWSYFFIASPLPGTTMYQECLDNGYIETGDFDPVRSFHKSIIRTPEFDPEYLGQVREEAIIDVNFRNNPNLLRYDVDKAIGSFKEVVDRYPHFDFANFYLGQAYLKKGDIDSAIDSYRKTLAANPMHRQAAAKLQHLKIKKVSI
jgi:magnesium-protoporphyrin IX monomethyl ester (oxidative) cyclase